jgi:NTP pyrophosphatase (non-canonical NTP hydrolase)
MKKIFDEIHEINKLDDVGVDKALCKLAEEFGELAQEVNKVIGRKTHNLTSEQIKDNIREECADVIQNTICIADKMGIPYEDLVRDMATKNIKWRKKVDGK